MTMSVKSLGNRPRVDGAGMYEAFEILHQASPGETWPQGPVLPECHILQTADGTRYEIAVSETVETRLSGVRGHVQYMHRYLCTLAGPEL